MGMIRRVFFGEVKFGCDLEDSCDWQEYTIERGSGTAESRRGCASEILLRDLE